MPSGGYRQPGKSAAVSGPGAYSARTDRPQVEQLAEGYGENGEMRSLRQASPVQPTRKPTVAPGRGGGGGGMPQVTPFGAPTERPDEPVTAGAPLGPGPGPEALGLPLTPQQEMAADVETIPIGLRQAFILATQRPDATPGLKRLVRAIMAYS